MLKVIVTTAVAMSKTQLANLQAELEKKLSTTVNVEAKVNPQVLGGVSLTIGSNHYDATYQYKLDQVRKALAQSN